MNRLFDLRWLGLALLATFLMGADCEIGAGTKCETDQDCEEHFDEHYCSSCNKCVLKDNDDSEAFWCEHTFERSHVSDEPVRGQCGEYSDRGIYDGQVKPFCQAAYTYDCYGSTQEKQATCDTLKDLSADGYSKCPYC